MLARLGNVLYWTGWLLGGLLVLAAVAFYNVIVVNGISPHVLDEATEAATAAVGAATMRPTGLASLLRLPPPQPHYILPPG
jgi:hypothetical protein